LPHTLRQLGVSDDRVYLAELFSVSGATIYREIARARRDPS
jgi:hypothetical protein